MMRCTNCGEDIDEEEDQIVEAIISSTQKFCHLQCFRCCICREQLTGWWYFEKNGELYCRKDYYHKYGERCRHCQNVMSGPVMVVGGEIKFHPECFKCDLCASIIGDDESYAFVEQQRLYCNQCFRTNNEQRSSWSSSSLTNTTTTTTTTTMTTTSASPTTTGGIYLQASIRFGPPHQQLQPQQQRRRSSNGGVGTTIEADGVNRTVQVIEILPSSNGRQRRIRLALRDCVSGCTHAYTDKRRSKSSKVSLFSVDPAVRPGNQSENAINRLDSCNDFVSSPTKTTATSTTTTTMTSSMHSNCGDDVDCSNSKIVESNSSIQCKIDRAYCFSSNNHNRNNRPPPYPSSIVIESVSHSPDVHISEIDVAYDLDLLHIGDRILEVNGVSISNKSPQEIEKLIERSRDQVIRLTVEPSSVHSSQNLQHQLPSQPKPTQVQSLSHTSAITSSASVSPSVSATVNIDLSANNVCSEPFRVPANGSTLNNSSGQRSDLRHCRGDAAGAVVSLSASDAKHRVSPPNNKLISNGGDATVQDRVELALPQCYTIPATSNISQPTSAALNASASSNIGSNSMKLTVRPKTAAGFPPLSSAPSATSTETNGTTKYPLSTPSKSMDNSRKSRSLEKRQRNRERSSSLSRLLESIRLSSESSPADVCDSSRTSPFNNISNQLTMSHSQSSSYFSPSRNGFSLKSNNSLSRTKSFRVEPKSYRIFRANDLVKGDLLGKGFFGEVFEVTDKVTKEKMVLKELYHNDREAEANFVREVSILKSLSHKNVLQFIGILYRGKKLNLITEYITGGTLRQLIQDESRPTFWPERINWARDIASGVNYLHSMNLIHRDLNSQNCLVRDDGTVVVADFGLSKITSVNSSSETSDVKATNNSNGDNNVNTENSLTPQQLQKLNRRRDRRKRYTIVGNPFWMAPEMMHRNKYDERVDIYSFGIILLEIIGSVNADPDVLKRNRDFSVDRKYFLENYVHKSCPEVFWKISFLCTEMNPDMRPPFHVLERWFQFICNGLQPHTSNRRSTHNVNHTSTTVAVAPELVLHDDVVDYTPYIPRDILDEVANYNNNGLNNGFGISITLNNSSLSPHGAATNNSNNDGEDGDSSNNGNKNSNNSSILNEHRLI